MHKDKNQEEQETKEKESEQKKKREDEKLDEELKQTFPASDPLSYSNRVVIKRMEE
ncbi:MAG: hypothetical protein WD317_08385 [Balneolaceae bacterium]